MYLTFDEYLSTTEKCEFETASEYGSDPLQQMKVVDLEMLIHRIRSRIIQHRHKVTK